ncbi:MAG: GrpB family protein [Candidatus Thorarchaeota archaeon]|nr:MAG: GrpB family protein [Candidatus Thorarchaeota archaeon]
MIELVEIESNDSYWGDVFKQQKALLESIMKDEIESVYHIGSTAIPGIHAKPIVDILVVVKDIERVDAYDPTFRENGYEPNGEHGIPRRRFFDRRRSQNDSSSTIHVHTFQIGSPNVERHINFRDYLLAHPYEAKKYEALKLELAQTFRDDRLAYTDGKSEFIRSIEEKALRWRASH